MVKLHEILSPRAQPCAITVYESSALLDIRHKLEIVVESSHDPIAMGIRNMLQSETKINTIILEVKQMAKTDYSYMSHLLGPALIDQIVNF